VRVNVPDKDNGASIIHTNDQGISVVADVEDDELVSDGVCASVRVTDVVRVLPGRLLSDPMPRAQWLFGFGVLRNRERIT
jgi:hypothetical protein